MCVGLCTVKKLYFEQNLFWIEMMDVIKFRNSYFLACTFKYILLNMFMNILYSVGGGGSFTTPKTSLITRGEQQTVFRLNMSRGVKNGVYTAFVIKFTLTFTTNQIHIIQYLIFPPSLIVLLFRG